MIDIQPGMDVARQVRRFDARIADNPTEAIYWSYLKGLMLASVALGKPQPFSHFAPMADEEFGR